MDIGILSFILVVLSVCYGRWSYLRQVEKGWWTASPCRQPPVDGGELSDMSMYLEMGEF